MVAAADVPDQIAEAEGLLCPAPFPVGPELLDRAPKLRVVSNFGVGFNNVDVPDLTRRGIAVCNTPGVLSDCVADLTMGLILTASRQIVANAAHVSSGRWSFGFPGPGLGFDVGGKTLGLVGYGRIGRATARRARAFNMNIVFHDVYQEAGDDLARYRSLDALLSESDIVSVHTNLTPETTHLIGARELALMKPSAWLINTARGPVVDESALAAALHAGSIAGAALDVLEVEPPPKEAPILTAPNVIILPHIGSATTETRAAMLELCLDNLAAVISRKRPPECVNPEALERALTR